MKIPRTKKPLRATLRELATFTVIGMQLVEVVWMITEAVKARNTELDAAGAGDEQPGAGEPLPTPEPEPAKGTTDE